MNLRSRCKKDLDKWHVLGNGNFYLVSLRCATQWVLHVCWECAPHTDTDNPQPAKIQVGTNVSEADKSWIDMSASNHPLGWFQILVGNTTKQLKFMGIASLTHNINIWILTCNLIVDLDEFLLAIWHVLHDFFVCPKSQMNFYFIFFNSG